MISVRRLAFAKLNLSLAVRCRRADGYHDIDSLVQTIDLADEIVLAVSAGHDVSVTNTLGDLGARDLAHQAATRLLAAKDARRLVAIHITKRIPAGAGLGGGSSDAAAVLVALDRLTPPALPADALAALAAEIGSDVPLFLQGGLVRITGRGETVERQCATDLARFVVVVPPLACRTAAVYAAWDAQAAHERAAGGDDNDLAAAALTLYPEMRAVAAAVADVGADACGMSGSGSAWFSAFRDPAAAHDAATRFARQFEPCAVHVCRPTDAGSVDIGEDRR